MTTEFIRHAIRPTIILVTTLMTLGCADKEATKSDKNIEACFCDSVYTNKYSDTLKEFICYKNTMVYKYQIRQNSERLSRHRLDDKRWLYEEMTVTHDNKLTNDYKMFVSVGTRNNSVELKYNGEKADSIQVVIYKGNDTLYSKFHRNNIAIINPTYFNDPNNDIDINAYIFEKGINPMTHKLDSGNSISTITFIKANYLINNPLDTVLLKIKRCSTILK